MIELFLGLVITLAWDAPEGPVTGYLLCANNQCQNIGNVTEVQITVIEFPTTVIVKPYDQDGVEGDSAELVIDSTPPAPPKGFSVK